MREKVVQGQFSNVKKPLNTRNLKLACMAFAILVLLGGLSVWYRHERASRNDQNTAFATMINQTTPLINRGDYTTAEQLVQQYLDKFPSTTHRRETYFQMANAYSAAGDGKRLLMWYQKIAALDKMPQLDVVTGLAFTYQGLHDNAHAIAYFKQAIALTEKTTDPMKDSNIATYKFLIQQMGGSL